MWRKQKNGCLPPKGSLVRFDDQYRSMKLVLRGQLGGVGDCMHSKELEAREMQQLGWKRLAVDATCPCPVGK